MIHIIDTGSDFDRADLFGPGFSFYILPLAGVFPRKENSSIFRRF